jgi:prolyl-tRNA editing enzyme YbaK/EbsC (Cys-tRNA(Pro) deacylase)
MTQDGAPLPPAAQRVQDALAALGFGNRVLRMERSARTAAEAAAAVGCDVGQIAKSLVFALRARQAALLVITSGANRVDPTKLAQIVGEPVDKADADFVRAHTGFAIGGVAPVAHTRALTTLIDEDLMAWGEIWAAAGHPNSVFRLSPGELVRITGGRIVAVK